MTKNEHEILWPVAMESKIPAWNAVVFLNKSPDLTRSERRARTHYQHDQGSGRKRVLGLLQLRTTRYSSSDELRTPRRMSPREIRPCASFR